MTSNQITLNPYSIIRILGLVAFLLIIASIVGQLMTHLTGHGHIYGLVPLLNLDNENNIPTFFSSFLLLFAALLLMVITILARNSKASYVSGWAILSSGFLFMAFDEAFSLHEELNEPTRTLLGNDIHGVFYYSWVIPAIPLVLVIALFFLKFLLYLPAKTRLNFLIGAILYIGGAIGIEMIGGFYASLYGTYNLTYSMIVTVEESLEMAGSIIFIWALLEYIADKHKEVRLMFDSARGDGT